MSAFDAAVIALAVVGAFPVVVTGVLWGQRRGYCRATHHSEPESLFAEIKEKLTPEERVAVETNIRAISPFPASFDSATAIIAYADVKNVLARHPELCERFDALYRLPLARRIEASLHGTPRDRSGAYGGSSLGPSKLSLVRLSAAGRRERNDGGS
jgi:hypothetical protein